MTEVFFVRPKMSRMCLFSVVVGAPSGDMGGRMSSGVPHIPSHDAIGDLVNTIRAPVDDAALQNEEEEEESFSDEEEESKE